MSEYYTVSGWPATNATLASAPGRAELNLISAGFDKLPTLSGNANKAVFINGAGNALTSVTEATAKQLLNLEIGTDVQAYDAGLTDIASLAVTDGNIIVGDGANWVAESGATARASLGLGSIATQAASSVTITGGSISGITDLAVADGGTGASDAATARSNLSAVGTTHSGTVSITGQLNADNLRLDGNTLSSTDTNGNVVLTPNGSGSIILDPGNGLASIRSTGSVGTELSFLQLESANATIKGKIGHHTGTDVMTITNQVHGGRVDIYGENSGGTPVGLAVFDPDGPSVQLVGTTISAAGLALMDDANAAAQLVTLGLTATAAELNTLAGIIASVTELNGVADGYLSGSYAATTIGLATEINVTVYYQKIDDFVHIEVVPATDTGTSDSTSFGITGTNIPAALVPSSVSPAFAIAPMIDNGANAGPVYAVMNGTGAISLRNNDTADASWTNTGTKGFAFSGSEGGFSFGYRVS